MQILDRHLAVPLHRAVQENTVVALTGPRGSGKAALARREFPGLPYVNLAHHADRQRARENPAGFLGSLRGRAIVDEAHRAPELCAAARELATSLLLVAPLRLALPDVPELNLYAPSLAEREGRPAASLTTLARFDTPSAPPPRHLRLEALLNGPPLDEEALVGDVRTLVGLHDADPFLRFAHAVAGASGQIAEQSEWARACGVTHTTIARWLDALDRTFHLLQLPPVTVESGMRQVRRRKLYCLNAGWVPAASRFEAWAVAEIVKSFAHRGEEAEFRHWTLATGTATGLVAETAEAAIAVTVTRLPAAPPSMIAAARKWCALAPHHASCVITAGAGSAAHGSVRVHPWWRI